MILNLIRWKKDDFIEVQHIHGNWLVAVTYYARILHDSSGSSWSSKEKEIFETCDAITVWAECHVQLKRPDGWAQEFHGNFWIEPRKILIKMEQVVGKS